jgi:hypothetical protein
VTTKVSLGNITDKIKELNEQLKTLGMHIFVANNKNEKIQM